MQQFEIQPGRDDWADGQPRARLVRNHNANQASVWDLTATEMLELYQAIHEHFVAKIRDDAEGARVWAQPARVPADLVYQAPCPCECNSGRFCGGCGHAGCGGRR